MFKYLDSPCAKGKTTAMIRHAALSAGAGEDYTIFSPSIKLCEQSYKNYKRIKGKKPSIITGDTVGKPVVALNAHYMQSDSKEGQTLFATQAGFIAMMLNGYVHEKHTRNLVFDEIPPIEVSIPTKIPHTAACIRDWLDIEDRTGEYGVIKCKNLSGFEQFLDQDEVLACGFRNLLSYLRKSNYIDVVVSIKSFYDLIDGKRKDMYAAGLIKPQMFDGFKSVTFMGANFKDSKMYVYYTNLGVKFSPHSLTDKMDNTPHDNGNEITIYYGYDTDRWSATLANKVIPGSPETYLTQLVGATEKLFGSEPYGYLSNKQKSTKKGAVFNKFEVTSPYATALPKNPFGHNDFRHLENIAIWAALNPTTPHLHLMAQNTGISPEQYMIAGYRETAYQSLMRGAARDNDNHNAKIFVVPDRGLADWLAPMFPGCTLQPLPGMQQPKGRQYKYKAKLTNNEINIITRTERKRVIHDAIRNLQEVKGMGTIFCSKFDKKGTLVDTSRPEVFIEQLRRFSHTNTPDTKEDNYLISPAHFVAKEGIDTVRGKENVSFTQHIYLDNDGGDLTHAEFAALFPRWTVVAYNSYNSTVDNVRYRIIIPTNDVMTIDAYEVMTRHILAVLNRNHYYSDNDFKKHRISKNPDNKRHGFDPTKLNAANLMYLPAINPAHPDAQFFALYNDDKRKIISAVDTLHHLINLPVPEDNTIVPTGNKLAEIRAKMAEKKRANPEVETKIEAAKTEYAAIPIGVHKRHENFFRLGLRLFRLGCNYNEIIVHLNSVAVDRKRQDQIGSIIKSLKTGRYSRTVGENFGPS